MIPARRVIISAHGAECRKPQMKNRRCSPRHKTRGAGPGSCACPRAPSAYGIRGRFSCEFDTVIIAGADDDNFPTYQAKVHNTLEEEKRVFYVAISRAKRTLNMTSTTQKVNRGGTWPLEQSRWIRNIPQEYVKTFSG